MKTKTLLFLFIAFVVLFQKAHAQVSVLTQHYSTDRLGANLHETTLNTSNVNTAGFGKLYSYPADGQIYAQPLYVYGLNIPGKGIRNVLFIATQHNTLYAYDADSLTAPLWQESFGPACPLPDPNFGSRYGAYHDIKVEIGITSTPVIDTATHTIYLVAFTKEGSNYYHKLHALDIRTGEPRAGSPKTIQATVNGTGDANVGGVISFESKQQLQRSSLLLSNGVIYFAFAGYADTDPYHGWFLGYDASTLDQKYVFNDSPDGNEGGIWMSGEAPSVDAQGNIYIVTGNGTYTANTGGRDYGDTFLKLTPTDTGLTVTDYFTPFNQQHLQDVDDDLGVDGPIQIPNTNLVVGGSKEGKIYVVDRTNMGHFNSSACNCDNQIVQSFFAFNGHLHGSLVYWEGPAGKHIYGWSEDDTLKSFKLTGSLFNPVRDMKGNVRSPGGMPGGILSVSANGSTAGTGIVWANIPLNANANTQTVTGVLRAYDASDLSVELWNSQQNPTRDSLGYFAKFNLPVVVNGKVYHSTFSDQLVVYGLNPPALALRKPENPAGAVNNVDYKYYTGSFSIMPPYSTLTPAQTGTAATFTSSVALATTNYALSFTGYISVPTDGLYTFFTNSDDGSQLFIGTQLVVDNDGPHGAQEVQGSIGLKAGKHKITVNYFQGTGGQAFSVSYQGPGIAKTIITAAVLYRVVPPVATASATSATVVCDGNVVHLSASAAAGQTYQWYKDGKKIYDYLAAAANYDAAKSGAYKVVITNGGGSDTSSAVNVTVHPNPDTIHVTGNATVVPGATESYNFAQTPGSAYSWTVTGGTANVTAGNTADITWGAAGAGDISITETDVNTCQHTTHVAVNISTATSINDANAGSPYFINTYPNPSVTATVVEFGAQPGVQVTVELYSTNGVKIATLFEGVSSGNNKLNFSTENLMNGVYACKLTTDSMVLNKYLLVVK